MLSLLLPHLWECSAGSGRCWSPRDAPAVICFAFAHVSPQSSWAPRAGEEEDPGTAQAGGVAGAPLSPQEPRGLPGVLRVLGTSPELLLGRALEGRNWIWWFSPVWNRTVDGRVCKNKTPHVGPGGPGPDAVGWPNGFC